MLISDTSTWGKYEEQIALYETAAWLLSSEGVLSTLESSHPLFPKLEDFVLKAI